MQKATQKITEQDFNRLFIDVIGETFSSLGESAKTAIYYHLGQKFRIKKDEMSVRVDTFAQALDRLFGIGNRPLEVILMRKLHTKVKTASKPIILMDVTLPKYANAFNQNLGSKDSHNITAKVDCKQDEKRCEDNKFTALLDLIVDPTVIVDEKGFLVIVNNAFETYTGLNSKDVIGTPFLNLPNVHPKSKAVLLENLKKRHMGLPVEPYEVVFTHHKTGEAGCCEVNAKRITHAGRFADLVVFRDVTQRKKNETQLKEYAEKLEWLVDKKAGEIIESEAKLRGTFESSPDAILVLDPNGVIVECNQAALTVFRYSLKTELIGKNGLELVEKGQREKIADIFQKLLVNEFMARDIEHTFLTKGGRKVFGEFSASIIKDSSGKHTSTVIVTKDISERKQLEDDLRSSEERFRAISTYASDAIVLLDKTDKILYWNLAAEKIFGYTKEEAVGKKLNQLTVPPKHHRAHLELLAKVLAHKKVSEKSFEIPALKKDGTEFPIELTVSYFKLKDAHCVLEIVRDVSERKKMEDALKQERDMLEGITENIGAGLTIISKDYHIMWANNLLKQINRDVEGKLCYMTFEKRQSPCPDCGVTKVFDSNSKFDSHEYQFRGEDGQQYTAQLIVTPIKDKHGNVIAALELTVDVTEKKQLQNKLAEYSQKLEQLVEERTKQLNQTQSKLVKSERLAAIGELAGMVGHDLRNPLTSIKGAAYFLKTKYSSVLDATGKEMLSTMDDSINYSNKIINDLLDYSREMILELSESTPKKMLKTAFSLIEVPEKIEICDATLDTPIVNIDTGKMSRVFVNMIKNAADAMPKGGKLTITSREAKGNWEIIFEDTGDGMSQETLDKLWTPLFTTKAKGMGFGLAICKRVLEGHGGKITAESTIGKGTRFMLEVPINPKTVAEETWICNPQLTVTNQTERSYNDAHKET